MKSFISKKIFPAALLFILSLGAARAEEKTPEPIATEPREVRVRERGGAGVTAESRYDRRLQRYREAWGTLIPSHAKLQFAGSMGFVSIGVGWDYGARHQFDTDILLGFIPKYSDRHVRFTLTVKQNYYPWRISLGKGFYFTPLAMGIYFNTILSDEYWVQAPERYPRGYYWFSTRVRTNIYLGEAITWEIPAERRRSAAAFSLYYEVGTNDFFIISAWGNREVRPLDILHLSIGIKTQWF